MIEGPVPLNLDQDDFFQKYANVDSITEIQKVNPYILVRDAYTGQGGVRSGGYLVKHARESDFKNRIGYSFYINFYKSIIEALTLPCFQSPPERTNDNGNILWDIFEDNCDNKGNSLNIFMRDLALILKRDGLIFAILENFESQPENLQGVIEDRVIPYIYTKTPLDVVYYQVDSFGNFEQIAFKDHYVKDGKIEDCFKVFTENDISLYLKYDKDKNEWSELIKTTPNALGVLPIIPIYNTSVIDGQILPTPPLYDVARLNIAVYNIWSEAREIMRKITFPVLTMPTEGQAPNLQLGTNNILGYPFNASRAPEFISPDPEIIKLYIETANTLREEAYRIAKINGVTGVIDSSGKAKEWDFQATKTELSSLSNTLQDAEYRIIDIFGRWINQQVKVTVKYIKDFGVSDLMGDIERSSTLLDMSLPSEIKKEIKKDLAMNIFSQKSPQQKNDLIESIETETLDQSQSE